MSTIEKGVSTETTAVTTNGYAEAAQQRVQELRNFREQIPRFVIPQTAKATQRLSTVAAIPAEFIELTNVAAANQAALVRGEGATPAEIRDLVAYADAYGPLADELEALAQFVRHSVIAARNKAGTEALTTYALAARLAKRPEMAALAPHVADMRRALGRIRKVSPEERARRAAERAAKAAAEAAKKRSTSKTPAPGTTNQQSS